jgi:hypothetical protein
MPTVIQILLAAAAIGVSVVALVRGGRTQNRLVKVDERLVSIEEKRETDRQLDARKARLTAFVDRGAHGSGHVLRVENSGAAEAREVKVLLDGVPVGDHSATATLPPEKGKTIVGPNSDIRYRVTLTGDMLPPSEIVVEWTDDSSEPGHYRNSLSW